MSFQNDVDALYNLISSIESGLIGSIEEFNKNTSCANKYLKYILAYGSMLVIIVLLPWILHFLEITNSLSISIISGLIIMLLTTAFNDFLKN